MKKSHPFDKVSTQECSVKGCKKKLKLRIVQTLPNADKCYGHYQELDRKNPKFRKGKRIDRNPQPEAGADE